MDKAATELEQVRKTLLGQVETLIESRDAAKELYLQMEGEKCAVDAQLRETENALGEIETQYETAQQNFLNMQGKHKRIKANENDRSSDIDSIFGAILVWSL